MAEEVLESLSMAEEVHAVAPEYQLWEVEARKLLSTAEVEVQIQGVALPGMPFSTGDSYHLSLPAPSSQVSPHHQPWLQILRNRSTKEQKLRAK